jgi:hypothetical protein
MRALFCTIALLSGLLACKDRQIGDATPSNLVQLRMGGCRGYCPSYTLLFRGDGSATYEGQQFVVRPGKMDFQISAEELKRLKKQLEQTKLWDYPERIESQVMDAPFATLTAYRGAESHAVLGTVDRPQPLLDLENLLKDLAEAHGLEVRRGLNPNDPLPEAGAEVIVQLKPELNAGNWAPAFKGAKLRLVRRIATENVWLMAYDTKEIAEAQLLELLRRSEGVVEVQANRQVKPRD